MSNLSVWLKHYVNLCYGDKNIRNKTHYYRVCNRIFTETC